MFEINNEDKLILMNRYGDIKNNNKILLTLCYIDNNHFQMIYEKNEKNAYKNKYLGNECLIDVKLTKNINFSEFNIKYASTNKKYTYEDIQQYIISKKNNDKAIYPENITNIKDKKKENIKRQILGTHVKILSMMKT